MKSTNWTSPTLNPFKAFISLVGAKQAGYNAWIERMNNEECAYPITEKHKSLNTIDGWESSGAYYCDWPEEKEKIISNDKLHPVEKDLMLNYTTLFGTEEDYQEYLEKGVINFRGHGKQYWVKYEDVIRERNLNPNTRFVPNVRPKGPYHVPKKMKHKVFVVCTDGHTEDGTSEWYVKLWNFITFPAKLIPKRSILKMDRYTNYSFRIGSVVNGYEVEFQIPKKFSFKN